VINTYKGSPQGDPRICMEKRMVKEYSFQHISIDKNVAAAHAYK